MCKVSQWPSLFIEVNMIQLQVRKMVLCEYFNEIMILFRQLNIIVKSEYIDAKYTSITLEIWCSVETCIYVNNRGNICYISIAFNTSDYDTFQLESVTYNIQWHEMNVFGLSTARLYNIICVVKI